MPFPKKKEKKREGAADWLTTYGDMVTLLLTFFVMMFTTAEVDGYKLQLILAAFQGVGSLDGGNTLQEGKLSELGNTIMTLPSMEKGRALDKAKKLATSLFQPDVQTKKIRITEDERGLVISLAADSFFGPATAEVDIENNREILRNLALMLSSETLEGRMFRIEGHTDSIPTDPNGEWETNWELSIERATNMLHALTDYGVNEERFHVSGFADTKPIATNETPEGRAYNRRVEIIILTEGHM